MIFTSELISDAKIFGYGPTLTSCGKLIRMFHCPNCKKTSAIKFIKNNKSKKSKVKSLIACKCGYRK